jgi:hypothetical protein
VPIGTYTRTFLFPKERSPGKRPRRSAGANCTSKPTITRTIPNIMRILPGIIARAFHCERVVPRSSRSPHDGDDERVAGRSRQTDFRGAALRWIVSRRCFGITLSVTSPRNSASGSH